MNQTDFSKIALPVFQYLLSLFFLFVAVTAFSFAVLPGVLLLVCAIIPLPYIRKKLANTPLGPTKSSVLLVLVLFCYAMWIIGDPAI